MKPWVAPEKRPSVMSATDSDNPSPTIAPVTWSISRIPGPLAAVGEGDMIVIDVERRALDVELSDDEISARLRELPPFAPKVEAGVLAKYAALVQPASEGAVTTPHR